MRRRIHVHMRRRIHVLMRRRIHALVLYTSVYTVIRFY
jgi:hypothetical protein